MIVMNSALTLLSLFTFFSLSVRAQYVSSSGSSPTSSAGASSETDSGSACTPGNVHQVTVGKNGNQFDPSITFAHPGDVVVFSFFPSNHSVIRTDYTGTKSDTEYSHNPCVPIEVLQPGTKGFFSGNKLLESPPSSGNPVTWNLTIVDRNPIWFYCDAIGSCYPSGMIGVINPNSTGTFQKQQSAAVSALFQLSPTGPVTPSGGESTHSQHSLSAGAIAGIAIGAIVVLALVAALCYFIGRTKTYKNMLQVKAPSEHASQPKMAHAKFANPSSYAGDPSAFRNTTFSDTTTVGGSMVEYEHGSMRSSPRPADPPGYPNMSFNITTLDDIPRSYESRATEFHPANAISPHGIPPYELAGTPSGVS